MKSFILIILLATMYLAQGCYYNSEEFLFPEIGNDCDTTVVNYVQSVVPIIENNCLSCHSNTSATALGGNVRLEDYDDIKLRADDGKLLGTISHTPGFVPMPDGAPKLPDCNIDIIRLWIEAGALDN
jgi:hypothetical protein